MNSQPNPILVLGAGRSSVSLLRYLNDIAVEGDFRFTVADTDSTGLSLRTQGLNRSDCFVFQALNPEGLVSLLEGAAIVISLLPPPLHPLVARACIQTRSHLITASYESPEMREMAGEVEAKGLCFLNECGLDPGIDHMSAMKEIESIRKAGGIITRFHSYCGGLVADEFDENPFRYKISWNPRNVVLAGKDGARYLSKGRIAILPYQRLFSETERIEVHGWGVFDAYPNRDSVPYARLYGIEEGIQDLKRGTLRKPGFSQRWSLLVRAGLTDDETHLVFPVGASAFDFLKAFFPSIEKGDFGSFSEFCEDPQFARDILDLGFGGSLPVPLEKTSGTPADFLLELVVKKWVLNPFDRDLVVMQHEFRYQLEGEEYQRIASFGLEGADAVHTAMAQTVGLPLGIAAKHLMLRNITQKGLVLPLHASIFEPILKELSPLGVDFQVATQPLLKK